MRISSRGRVMTKDYDQLNIRQKMEILVEDMVEKELPMKEALREFQKIYIETAARKYNRTKTRMARALGVYRNTLNNHIKSLKIK